MPIVVAKLSMVCLMCQGHQLKCDLNRNNSNNYFTVNYYNYIKECLKILALMKSQQCTTKAFLSNSLLQSNHKEFYFMILILHFTYSSISWFAFCYSHTVLFHDSHFAHHIKMYLIILHIYLNVAVGFP